MRMNPYPALARPRARAGNAMLIAVGLLGMMITLIAASTGSAVSNIRDNHQAFDRQRTLAAAEAVATRREQMVIDLGNRGDPSEFARWKANFGIDNYGVDYVGECEVRWRIEPVRTEEQNRVGDDIEYITNPAPGVSTTVEGKELTNDYIYLFRIATEARLNSTRRYADGELVPSSRAQCVRYASVSKQPLFRYVIFYAQKGPKGDLELSHGDRALIKGNIHSNGAIYLGSSTLVNHWGATAPYQSPTHIGPDIDGKPVFVTGVDGIFRLCKPLMYGALNRAIDSTWSGMTMLGSPPSGWSPTSAYNLTATLFPGETAVPNTASVGSATANGTLINPYRVLSASGFATVPLGGDESDSNSNQTINDIPLIGYGASANDSRDAERSSSRSWSTLSLGAPPDGFKGYARTAVTNARTTSLNSELTSRPLEPQPLDEIDLDGDPTTDEQQAAQLQFQLPAGDTTPDYPATDPVVEAAGKYLGHALGEEGPAAQRTLRMTRLADGTGWVITDRSGIAIPPDKQLPLVGLLIRERPLPATDIWPGTKTVPIVDPSSPWYLPFSYGKHWRPTAQPFTPMDIAADSAYENEDGNAARRGFSQLSDSADTVGSNDAWRDFKLDPDSRWERYDSNGAFTVFSGCTPGPYYAGGQSPGYFAPGRKPYYFGDNWRFIHLKQVKPSTTAGVTARYWNDPIDDNLRNSLGGVQQCTLSGPATLTRNEAQMDMGSSPGGLVHSDNISGRWEAFLTPQTTARYTFGVKADDECRVWVNGSLVVSQPTYSSNNLWWGREVTLSNTNSYHVVMEFCEGGGGENANLYWKSPSMGATKVPSSVFHEVDPGFGFDWGTFRAIQARIVLPDGATGPVQQKVGVMVRPAEGASPLQNGHDPYVASLFSPFRGYFSQRRLAPARIAGAKRQYLREFIGSTDAASATQVDVNGEVGVAMGSADPIRRALVTPTGSWTTTLDPVQTITHTQSTSRVVTTKTPGSVTYTSKSMVPAGDGYFLNNVVLGQPGGIILSVSKQRQMRSSTYTELSQTRRGTVTLDLSLNVPAGLFLTGDSADTIWFYNNPTGSGAAKTWNGNSWNVISGTRIARTWTNTATTNNSASNGWSDYGSPTSGTSINFGDDKVIFDPLPKRVNASGTVSGSAPTASEVVAIMNATYGGGFSYRASQPSYPSVANPATGPVPPEAGTPATPSPGTLGDPWGGTVSRYFCVERDNSPTYALQDVNAWVSGSATWFDPPVDAFLPWVASWSGTTVSDSVTPVPQTGGFSPELWFGATGPQRTPWDATTDAAQTGLVNLAGRWADDQPAGSWTYDPGLNHIVRIERDMGAATPTLVCRYYEGTSFDPVSSDPGWHDVSAPADISDWLSSYQSRSDAADPDTMQLLVGLCVQSGDKDQPIEAQFKDVRIETEDGLINGAIWDGDAGGVRDLSSYLASQYQVFWGIYDITEDFFTYGENALDSRLATEDWIWNPREFWSQSRWWDDAQTIDKDPAPSPVGSWTTFGDTTFRQLFAKTTLLTLNMRTIQDYLKTRTLADAVDRPITGAAPPTLPAGEDAALLKDRFNGLFYAVRTNRFPWNPTPDRTNPYSCRSRPLPNWAISGTDAVNTDVDHTLTWHPADTSLTQFPFEHDGVNLLQPYPYLPRAPAIRPQDFFQGVRIKNAASIDWGLPTAGIPDFGTSKTTIATPNQLFIQGDLNTTTRPSNVKGHTESKETPLAVMGDVVVLLSNAWRDENYQAAGLTCSNGSPGYTGGGVLAKNGGWNASPTSYTAAIMTHNQPTTKQSVREGQGAPFIDTMMFLESWPTSSTGPTMQFKGSLVVMNSRRYTHAFLLDSAKESGRTPFGITGWQKSPPDWYGKTPTVYAAPTRGFDFNYDLLTEEGTPPFTPFGVTASGLGGWSKNL